MLELRYRPGRDPEVAARAIVRARYLAATSRYCEDGAMVYDVMTAKAHGTVTSGDCAVEMAWQDATGRAALA
ncbi:hypothetical protein [Paraburkholderia sp. J11-2]|uniref:hypothetical protein n=1 Tax=Paraburkholderia sp. J11-2 TaxID=2805431 RepID=UPI002AB6F5EE|nr:hypothetical protein [Paraburkholderia sp. J11-2]